MLGTHEIHHRLAQSHFDRPGNRRIGGDREKLDGQTIGRVAGDKGRQVVVIAQRGILARDFDEFLPSVVAARDARSF
jgi:hypothetical protein